MFVRLEYIQLCVYTEAHEISIRLVITDDLANSWRKLLGVSSTEVKGSYSKSAAAENAAERRKCRGGGHIS